MPNPWDVLDKTLKMANAQRELIVKNWIFDICPVCRMKPFMASKDQWNHRYCENGHMWRRCEDGAYILIEGQKQSRIAAIHYPNAGLIVSIETVNEKSL